MVTSTYTYRAVKAPASAAATAAAYGVAPTRTYAAYSNGVVVATVTGNATTGWHAASGARYSTRNKAVAVWLAGNTYLACATPTPAHVATCQGLCHHGCTACGLVAGQAPACATGCNPTAPCPVCPAHAVCTGCGMCYGCGGCAYCVPCQACTACMGNGNGPVACTACYRANHQGAHQ